MLSRHRRRLSNLEVEPDETKHSLFEDDVNVYKTINGKQTLVTLEPFEGDRDTRFKTPLWYYVSARKRGAGKRCAPRRSRQHDRG